MLRSGKTPADIQAAQPQLRIPAHAEAESRRHRMLYATRAACASACPSAMALPPDTAIETAALTATLAEPSAEPAEVEYPEGHWIAQSTAHGVAVLQATAALGLHFRQRADVLVAMELMVYFERDNNQAKLQPDVQVVLGVPGELPRSSYRVWEEGKAPDFVLEVASPSTERRDALLKAHEYARIGVREYWRLDPAGSLMSSPLERYEASGGVSGRPATELRGGRRRALRSAVLGLELRSARQSGATVLVFRDPATGHEFDGALAQAEERANAEAQRANAEAQRANAEAQRRRAAEERVRALEQQLRKFVAPSPPPDPKP